MSRRSKIGESGRHIAQAFIYTQTSAPAKTVMGACRHTGYLESTDGSDAAVPSQSALYLTFVNNAMSRQLRHALDACFQAALVLREDMIEDRESVGSNILPRI